jgi:hypothetical protein
MKDNEKRHHKSEQKQGCNGGSKPDEKIFGHEDNFWAKVGKLLLFAIHFVGDDVNELLSSSNMKEPKATPLHFRSISHVFQTRRIRRVKIYLSMSLFNQTPIFFRNLVLQSEISHTWKKIHPLKI